MFSAGLLSDSISISTAVAPGKSLSWSEHPQKHQGPFLGNECNSDGFSLLRSNQLIIAMIAVTMTMTGHRG